MNSDLFLIPIRAKDVDHVMSWINDSEVVKNFQNFNKKFTRAEELRFIKRLIKSKNDRVFSIFRRADGEYVGQCGINQIVYQNKLGRVSLMLKKEFWGHGYAQESLKLLLRRAFQTLKLHKVWLMVYATNKKGLHIYKKLGFKPEGVLREEYFWRGRYHDIIRMGLLAPDFKL